MIKINIEIKEQDCYELKNTKATGIEVTFKEIGIKASKTEKEVSKVIKERINPDHKKVEVLDKTKQKNLDKLIELLNNL